MKRQMLLLLFAGLVSSLEVSRLAAQPTPITLPNRFSYGAKFLCGFSSPTTTSPPKEPAVKRGNYATIINIHNPHIGEVVIVKKVVLPLPQQHPNTGRPIPPTRRFIDRVPSDHALSVDCTEIVNLLALNGTPVPAGTTFIEGFLVIDSFFPTGNNPAAEVDVAIVTTSAQSTTAAVNDFEITYVTPKRLPAGTWPF